MKSIRIGFTGTKDGMDVNQKADILVLFTGFVGKYDEIEFHHGDCIGADAQAAIAMAAIRQQLIDHFGPNPPCRIRIICHPGYIANRPDDTRFRAFTKCNDEVREPKPFIARDHDIVDETDEMVATPLTRIEQVQSGTWTTVRYARKKNKTVTILNPAGPKFDPHAPPPQRINAIAGQNEQHTPEGMKRGFRKYE